MVIGRPRHRAHIGYLALIGTVDLHCPDFSDRPVRREASPAQPRADWRKEWAAVVARLTGESSDVFAVGIHYIDVIESGRVEIKLFFLRRCQLTVVTTTIGRERDQLAVG